jgi:hypothetical protein
MGGEGFSEGDLNPSRRLRFKYLGENNHFFGKFHSEETRKKISKSRSGKGARFGKDNPMFGKDHSGEKNPMFGRKRDLHPNVKMYLIEYINGNSEILTSKECEVKFGIAFSRIRSCGGILSYKKKTQNIIYEGTRVTLL